MAEDQSALAPDGTAILHWLSQKGMKASGISHLINGFVEQLNLHGVGLFRCAVLMKTLHPQIEMIYYSWKPTDAEVPHVESYFELGRTTYQFAKSAVEKIIFQHGGARNSDGFQQSPFKELDDSAQWIRRPLTRPLTPAQQRFDYPILQELFALGGTDYFAASLNTQTDRCDLSNQMSWCTNKPGGFTDRDITLLKQTSEYFAMCLAMHLNRYITETLLTVYLGEHSGKNVLNGKIQRGDVEVLEAAIWFSDLRGFTSMSQNVDSEILVAWLNLS